MTQNSKLSNTKNSQITQIMPSFLNGYWLLAVMLFAAAVFVVRNLPWHLDNYDQAKQAFAAMDVVRGNWLIQNLPMGGYATKPPLVAWLQAGAYYLTLGNWPLAFRLPGYLAALTMLWLISRTGHKMAGMTGAVIAGSAFAFNMLSIRIATLVRTDMILAFLCFLPGLLVWQHVRLSVKWSLKARTTFSVLLTAGILAKGHSVYAFFVPGLLVYAFILWRRKETDYAWPGVCVLLLPLVLFLTLAGWVVWRNPAYYDQVIVGEIYSVFSSGSSGGHTQPFYYYGVHLLQKWAPWSLALCCYLWYDFRRLREYWKDHEFVWLVCWVLGGMAIMSVIPQKRVDRIYPVIAPLSLLLVYFISHSKRIAVGRVPIPFFFSGLVVLGISAWSIYTGMEIMSDYWRNANGLRKFSQEMMSRTNAGSIEVVAPCAEGFVCYFDKKSPIRIEEAVALHEKESSYLVVLTRQFLEEHADILRPYHTIDCINDPFDNDQQYVCIEVD